jgi:hypothetical protein
VKNRCQWFNLPGKILFRLHPENQGFNRIFLKNQGKSEETGPSKFFKKYTWPIPDWVLSILSTNYQLP